MGAIINRMAYAWLVTSEVFEELVFNASDFFRRIAYDVGAREQAPKHESRIYTRQTSTAKATDAI
ncbi:MAG: hypothetical protein FJ004_07835 [Chloroflexi bacterium]|nr:hypothetical protein [Chloroflexota bacterium]